MSIGDGPFSALGIAYPPTVGGGPVERVNSLLDIANTPDMWAMINKEEIMRNMMQASQMDMSAAQQAGGFTPPSKPNQPANPPALAARAREMFLKRMGGIRAEMKVAPVDFLQCHIFNDQVYVFYCFGGRNGVTNEGIDLFPSDQLITQFRLVLT